MAAQFVTSDSEHDSEGATPIHEAPSGPLTHAKSTPGQIFNATENNSDFATMTNPFDDDFDTDPFAEDNPKNPFRNPFGENAFNAINSNYKKNKERNKRTNAMREVQEKRSKTPEPEMPAIFSANNDPNRNPFYSHSKQSHSQTAAAKGVNRRHSQPVNSMYSDNINKQTDLDDIFADFVPQTAKAIAATAADPLANNINHKRSKSVMISTEEENKLKLKKRRKSQEVKQGSDELEVAQKTGYDIAYFVDRDIAYKYLCIICENICRNAVELTCIKKRHLCCSYCISKYFEIHGNKCPIHPEHRNLSYSSSRYSKYHIESLRVQCPYSTASAITGACLWRDTLKNLDAHCIEHTQFVRCPFSDYGCVSKLKIEAHHANNDEALKEHLISSQHQHLIYVLSKTQQLRRDLQQQNATIAILRENEAMMAQKVQYLCCGSRIADIDNNNIWILCGSHKYWKHKYNQLFSVNLRNGVRTAIRIYDIERMSVNSAIKTSTNTSTSTNNNSINNDSAAAIYDPTQSDSWDVGDLGVAHVSHNFHVPIWLQKKYPTLNCFNRDRFNSIIFRCGGHLIRDKKVTARVDAILFDSHFVTGNISHPSTINMQNAAIHAQQLTGYKLNCFPTLPSKRYNCECVYSQRNGLIVVGGSGVDKNQINAVNQLKIRDSDVNITYDKEDDKKENKSTSYPRNNSFNITLEWKSLSAISRAREDTAICLFSDKNICWKEYIIICGGWSNGCLRSAELYNFGVNKWINLPTMNVKHNAAGITEWKENNSIVVVGGFNTEAHFAAEYFEMIKQKWCKLPNTNYKHRYKPAVWCKSQNQQQIICCAGSGVLKNEVGTVEFLDTRDNKWCVVKKPLAKLLGLNANINANNWRMWRIFN